MNVHTVLRQILLLDLKKNETSKIKQNKIYEDLYDLIVKKSCISTFFGLRLEF
jgi:hypothetical protein